MKKLITLLLIAALLLPAAALADLPDISGLTHNELIELNHRIQMRLFSEKLINGVNIPIGRYTVGEDIPAGSYRVAISAENGLIAISSPEGKSVCSYLVGSTFNVAEIGKITIEEGQIFDLTYCSVTLYPYSGLF